MRVNSRLKDKEKNNQIELLLEPNKANKELLLEFLECGRKTQYSTPEEIEKDANYKAIEETHIYLCSYCSKYHFGHPPGATVPEYYKITRARMLWNCQRKKANAFLLYKGFVAEL